MKISYDYGHMEGGQDGSADGILYEYRVAREYGKVCIDYLTKEGVTCIDCTPPDEFMSLLESLDYRVNKANENVCDLHISFHANWYYGKGEGAEIEVYSEAGREKAFPVLSGICSLGFAARGVKYDKDLYVLKHTNAIAMLIEPFFVDNQNDCNLYNSQKLGKAIAEGILGYKIKPKTWEDILYAESANAIDWIPRIKLEVEKGDSILRFLPQLIENLYLKEGK